jgi:hypothetical protein
MRPASISFLIEAASLEVDRSVRGRVYILIADITLSRNQNSDRRGRRTEVEVRRPDSPFFVLLGVGLAQSRLTRSGVR